MKIIILNGPPRSGKDTVVLTLRDMGYEFAHVKFAQPIRDAMCGLLGIRDEEIEEYKEKDPNFRKAMIDISEKVAKKYYGKFFFAERAANIVKGSCRGMNVVVSDGGFGYEVGHFVSTVRTYIHKPAPGIKIWQCHRPGCTFENDSREWVRLKGVDLIQLHNSAELATYKAAIQANAEAFWGRP